MLTPAVSVSTHTPPNIVYTVHISVCVVLCIKTEDINVSVCHLPPDSVALSHVNIEHTLELCTPP